MLNDNNIANLVRDAREKKGISARELAKLCDISHTEINNIESGKRVKPAILTLKAFEKYLDLDYKVLARLVGYCEETIVYGNENIIVSYERYDKKLKDFSRVKEILLHEIDIKRHFGMDIKECYDVIYNYLKSIDNIDADLIKKADEINRLLNVVIEKFNENKLDFIDK